MSLCIRDGISTIVSGGSCPATTGRAVCTSALATSDPGIGFRRTISGIIPRIVRCPCAGLLRDGRRRFGRRPLSARPAEAIWVVPVPHACAPRAPFELRPEARQSSIGLLRARRAPPGSVGPDQVRKFGAELRGQLRAAGSCASPRSTTGAAEHFAARLPHRRAEAQSVALDALGREAGPDGRQALVRRVGSPLEAPALAPGHREEVAAARADRRPAGRAEAGAPHPAADADGGLAPRG